MKTVNISPYKASGARIFSDRDKGIEVRKALNLDNIEGEDEIMVLIPEDTWGINPSFFGGLFESSIKRFGNDFFNKYSFQYEGQKQLKESLHNSIMYAFDKVMKEVEENA